MATRINPNLFQELKDYGAVDIEKCFNCGNCTAICSLTNAEDHFPRQMIRMAQVGLTDELLGSKEIWLCYNCGECSETCPKQAEPANFMAAARSYAISHYDSFGIGKFLGKKPIFSSVVVFLMVIFFGFFIYVQRQTMPTETLKFFDFIPYDWVHTVGLIALVVVSLISILAILNMMFRIAKANNLTAKSFFKGSRMNWIPAFWEAVVVQSLLQKRYREDCEKGAHQEQPPWLVSKWFVHASTMWGFLGLLSATGINFALDIVGLKTTGTFVPIWYPVRLLGTISGLFFVYGVTILLYRRWKASDKAHSNSRSSDWIFLILLWLTGITGFLLEIALYLPETAMWAYWMLIVHVAVSIVLLLLLPFSKFAHAIYRVVALYVHALKPIADVETQPAEAGMD